MKLLEKLQQKGQNVTQCIRPNQLLDKNDKIQLNSFLRWKSSEIRKLFPSSPSKFVKVLKHIWDQSYKSPRKRRYMSQYWNVNSKDMCAIMLKVGKYKAKKNTRKIQKLVLDIKSKYKSLRKASSYTPYSWTQFRRYISVKSVATTKLEYTHKLSLQTIAEIHSHLNCDDISFPVPDRKHAGKRFMRTSMKKSLDMYNLCETTKRPISISTLYRYRPKNVKLQGKIPLRQSCCEKCLNFENVSKEISKYLQGTYKYLNEAVDSTLCTYSGFFPKIECILRTCTNCGTDKLKESLLDINANKLEDKHKRFLVKQWISKNKDNNGVTQSYLHWKVDRCSYEDLIDRYIAQLDSMAEHTFTASWNYCQFKLAKKNLLPGQVILVHDFAQNYLCLMQNEPQGMHWGHKQVTLHPTVAYYVCPNEDCNKIVTHELVHLSDDLKHDAHLIKCFHHTTVQKLKERKIPIRKIIQFSDQAPSQYKNKCAFRYVSQIDIPTMLNFFGVRHGKGPCDACAGRVKQKVVNLLKTETCDIHNAADMFNACKEHLQTKEQYDGSCMHFLQTFEFTNRIATRPNTDKWTTVPDTRKLHSVTNCLGTQQINIKKFLCCCIGCMNGSECQNTVCPSPWTGFNLRTKKHVPPSLQTWTSPTVRKNLLSVDNANYWKEHIVQLSDISVFTDLQEYIQWNPLPALNANINVVMSEQDRQFLDFVALHYIPNDAPESFAPISIVGDGNCFPRTISYLLFRTQSHHEEIRTRIIYESINNMAMYLDNAYLQMGANHLYRRGTLAQQYAMYSDNYRPHIALDIENIYKSEVLDICHDGAYMGIWQIFQISNVIQMPVRSIYPQQTNANIRLDLNRIVWCKNVSANSREPINVMWTPMQVGNNRPCHFVPLLKVVRKVKCHT